MVKELIFLVEEPSMAEITSLEKENCPYNKYS